jgi:pilus assembly protein CpaE
MTIIVENLPASAELFAGAIGPSAEVVQSIEQLRRLLDQSPDEYAIVLGSSVDLITAVSLADTLRVQRPALSVILIRQRVDTSMLAEALRSGMREVVEERDLTGLAVAVRRARTLHAALTAGQTASTVTTHGRLLTVFSAKGGVGKTTVATNIAVSLSTSGHKVCLVDLDLGYGDVAITLQMFPTHTIADAVAMPDLDADMLEPLLTKYSDHMYALTAPTNPHAQEKIGHELVGQILAILKQRFDFVIVDTPPAFDDHVLQALDASDLLLLLLTLDIPALKNAKVTLETLELLNFPREKCRLVLNRADSKVGLTVDEVETTLKSKISGSIPSSREVPASINRGQPIVTSAPRSSVSETLNKLAQSCAIAMTVASHESVEKPESPTSANPKSHRRRLLRGRQR